MEEAYQIVNVEKPEQSAWGILGRSLHNYNIEQAGDDDSSRVCFVLQTAGEEIVGGVLGEIHWGWFYVDLMWLKEELRGRGYGHRLLTLAEDAARQRGARHAYLDTFSFQALDFYKGHGYQVFGELPDFPAGHRRYYMTKPL